MKNSEENLPPSADYTIPGLRIQKNVNPDAPWEVIIRAARRQKDWTIYREKKFYEPLIMDTVLHYQGRFYRIHEEEETSSGWIYRLKTRPPGEIMHKIVELTAEDIAQVQTEKAEFEKMSKLSHISIYYEIIFGFLPARIQNNLAERYYFSPEYASRKNALLEFFVFFSFSAIAIVGVFVGRSMDAFLIACGIFAMALEGYVRWSHALASNEPLGLFILEITDRIWQRLKRK